VPERAPPPPFGLRRGAAAAAFGLLVLSALACKGGMRSLGGPREGQPCSKVVAECSGTNEALFCIGSDIGKGRYQKVHCLGPRGCTSTANEVTCDTSRTDEGTPCPETWQAKAACGADQKTMLSCSFRKWEAQGPCRGPEGCRESGDEIVCDNSLSDVGDPCGKDNEGKVACSSDRTTRVMCRDGKFVPSLACVGPGRCDASGSSVKCDGMRGIAGGGCSAAGAECAASGKAKVSCKSGRFGPEIACLGAHGCQVVDEKVYCDQSIADEGAPCDDDGATSCASDGKRTLRCQNGAFVAGRACPHACKALAAPATAIAPVRCY
jgi:hypothetical protein